jgi:hypothetical protein
MPGATKVSNPRSLYSIADYCILALIFFPAAYGRFSLTPWPLADPDTPAYLEPAISKLAGAAFQHTNGRNFLYPGFLLLILGSANNFAAITFVQHLLGLMTGGLMLCCSRTTRQFIRRVSLPVHDGLGILIVPSTYSRASRLTSSINFGPKHASGTSGREGDTADGVVSSWRETLFYYISARRAGRAYRSVAQ